MARPIDFSTLSRSERIALFAGLGMLLNGMVRWWFRLEVTPGAYTFNSGLSGLTFASCLCGALAALAVLWRASIWPAPGYARDGELYAGLGSVSLTLLAVSLVTGRAHWVGFWVGAGLSLVLIVAGLMRREARRQGWT